MSRRILRAAISAIFAAIILGIWLMPHHAPPTANASGTGPTVALGTPSGLTVQVNATASPDPYMGFNLHVAAVPSAGVSLTAISGSFTGSTLDNGGPTGDLYCTTNVVSPHEVNYGCVAYGGQSATTSGWLATMSLAATGNGCVTVSLIDLPPGDPNAAVSDTYTVDQLTTTPQQNVVSASATQVIVGTGTAADCIAPASVGGVAHAPNLSARTLPSHEHSRAFAVVAFATAFACIVIRLHMRNRRRSEPAAIATPWSRRRSR